MRRAGRGEEDENDVVSLCSLYAGNETFGIDTRKVREVLGKRELHRVPVSPGFIAGVLPYRGEVLTAVSLRALLGLESHSGASCVLVMEDEDALERFGLVVDAVGGVVELGRRDLEPNPSTLDSKGRWLFAGAYKTENGLMVQLDPQKLGPSRLSETGLFERNVKGGIDASPDRR